MGPDVPNGQLLAYTGIADSTTRMTAIIISTSEQRPGRSPALLTIEALLAYIVGMKSNQYTLRDVPHAVDHALRSRAAREKRSLNSVALHVLAVGLGIGEEPPYARDLDALAGTWVEDPAFDVALQEMDTVDKDLWK